MSISRESGSTTTTPAGTTGAVPAVGDLLLVVGEGLLVTCALPADGEVVFGRDPGCTIVLDHVEISRRHAAVSGGASPTVRDLGSTNGIRVSGRRPAAEHPVRLGPGETFKLGPFIVQLLVPAVDARGSSNAAAGAVLVTDPSDDGPTPILDRIAKSTVSVVILGETGVGKEVLAKAVHRRSERRGAFLGVNCATLGNALLESELFGHERGAFTGADRAKPGLFEAAAGGTLFLDEVGELPSSAQAKLLRALETRQVMRLGGTKPIDVDVRFVAATHCDLHEAVATGGFRQDLYFRLNGITLRIPPLRERPGVIPSLVDEFLGATAGRLGEAPRQIAPAARAMLRQHTWPGNVRELRTVIERAVLLAGDDEIKPAHIMIEAPASREPPSVPPAIVASPDPSGKAERFSDGERDQILAALEACVGNQTRAARMLGISRATLVNRLTLYAVPRPRRR